MNLVLFLTFVLLVLSLRFTLEAGPQNYQPKCIRDFVAKNQLVVVHIKLNGKIGDGQELSFYIMDPNGNQYRSKKNFDGLQRVAFNLDEATSFDVCFENVLKRQGAQLLREIELDVESGYAARDWNLVQAAEKLKPSELELRRVEELTGEIVMELEYLRAREERMRDTNESTNRRVQNFSMVVIFSLVGLGVWQVWYLRNYFKSKHVI